MPESAILKTGKFMNSRWMKSTTKPLANLSMRLPIAPPSIIPIAILLDLSLIILGTNTSMRKTTMIARKAKIILPPWPSPQIVPRLCTLTIDNNPGISVLLWPRGILYETTIFESWSISTKMAKDNPILYRRCLGRFISITVLLFFFGFFCFGNCIRGGFMGSSCLVKKRGIHILKKIQECC